ncbi:MAG: 3-dehydroquinate synthase [Bacteroidales bacterium]|nr:3-dehydroquinate synthase [Bacteroidales bacterium]
MSNELTMSFERRVHSRIVSSGSIRDVAALLEGEREVYIVHDENVAWVAAELVDAAGESVKGCYAIDTSEKLKTMDTALHICRSLLEAGASRRALVLAVGGGITTDLAGFAASIYKRGVRYANIPTTLLAQVDAAIGGKTGVNLDDYKNMLGVIAMPQFTFICPSVLKTLPERELRAGIAEMLKTFLIADADSYHKAVSSMESAQSEDLILKAAAIKASIVERDPHEEEERMKLNLGHTFAHAIEHEARKRGDDIIHGEAVAMGVVLAAEMAEKKGIASKGLSNTLRADFQRLGLPTECPYTGLEEAMSKDKKADAGKIRFVLPVKPGEVTII